MGLEIPPPDQPSEHPAVAAVAAAVQQMTSTLMVPDGTLLPPTAHIFMDDLDQPYVGYVSARPYGYQGDDAALAIAGMGDLPAVVMASRLLVVWEEHDLAVSLNGRAASAAVGNALNMVEATFSGHVLRRTPFALDRVDYEVRSVTWGEQERRPEADLPAPITAAIQTWRRMGPADLEGTVTKMRAAGYRITFVTRGAA